MKIKQGNQEEVLIIIHIKMADMNIIRIYSSIDMCDRYLSISETESVIEKDLTLIQIKINMRVAVGPDDHVDRFLFNFDDTIVDFILPQNITMQSRTIFSFEAVFILDVDDKWVFNMQNFTML